MLCSACGGNPTDESWKKGPVKLRYTGRTDQPYVAVCERCGCDVDYSPRMSTASQNRINVLGKLEAEGSAPAGLFHP